MKLVYTEEKLKEIQHRTILHHREQEEEINKEPQKKSSEDSATVVFASPGGLQLEHCALKDINDTLVLQKSRIVIYFPVHQTAHLNGSGTRVCFTYEQIGGKTRQHLQDLANALGRRVGVLVFDAVPQVERANYALDNAAGVAAKWRPFVERTLKFLFDRSIFSGEVVHICSAEVRKVAVEMNFLRDLERRYSRDLQSDDGTVCFGAGKISIQCYGKVNEDGFFVRAKSSGTTPAK